MRPVVPRRAGARDARHPNDERRARRRARRRGDRRARRDAFGDAKRRTSEADLGTLGASGPRDPETLGLIRVRRPPRRESRALLPPEPFRDAFGRRSSGKQKAVSPVDPPPTIDGLTWRLRTRSRPFPRRRLRTTSPCELLLAAAKSPGVEPAGPGCLVDDPIPSRRCAVSPGYRVRFARPGGRHARRDRSRQLAG